MELVYPPVVGLVVGGFRLRRWNLTVTGGEHVPDRGGAIIATNHIGYLDFMVSGWAVRRATPSKRLVRFAAKKEVFDHPVSGPLMRGMKHLPVDRAGTATAVIDLAVERLGQGQLVGMFPEATISRSFVPLRGKRGTAMMAQRAGVPIVPGAIWGSQRLWTKGRPRNLGATDVPLTVDFAPPQHVGPDDDVGAATTRLMATIAELVDVAQRRYPDQPAGPDDAWWQPAHLGGAAPTPDRASALAREEARERRAARQGEQGDGRDTGS